MPTGGGCDACASLRKHVPWDCMHNGHNWNGHWCTSLTCSHEPYAQQPGWANAALVVTMYATGQAVQHVYTPGQPMRLHS